MLGTFYVSRCPHIVKNRYRLEILQRDLLLSKTHFIYSFVSKNLFTYRFSHKLQKGYAIRRILLNPKDSMNNQIPF